MKVLRAGRGVGVEGHTKHVLAGKQAGLCICDLLTIRTGATHNLACLCGNHHVDANVHAMMLHC